MEEKVFHPNLATPACTDLSKVYRLLLDDNLGIVTVIESDGIFTHYHFSTLEMTQQETIDCCTRSRTKYSRKRGKARFAL